MSEMLWKCTWRPSLLEACWFSARQLRHEAKQGVSGSEANPILWLPNNNVCIIYVFGPNSNAPPPGQAPLGLAVFTPVVPGEEDVLRFPSRL